MERMQTYDQIYRSFRWNIPARYNIAADVCDRHAGDPGKVALIGEDADGKVWRLTFLDVQRKANQLANLLCAIGLAKGDRVMLLLGQNPWTAIAHVACWKAGLVSVPVSTLFAADAVAYRLNHVDARVVITDAANLPTAARARAQATEPVRIYVVDGHEPEAELLTAALGQARDTFTNVDTAAEDPAFLNFTSGTTAEPKGVAISHGNLLANLEPLEAAMQPYLKYEWLVHPLRFLDLLPLSHVFGQFMGMFIPPLIGATAEERAECRMWTRRLDLNIAEPLANGYRYGEGQKFFEKRIVVVPEASAGLKKVAANRLQWLNGQMDDKREHICGKRFTLADVFLYCWLEFGNQVGQPLDQANSHIADWFARVGARPSVKA